MTALLETGMLPMTEPVTEVVLEAPAGLIRVRAACHDGKVTSVTFRNVPAFAAYLDTPIEVPHLGTVVGRRRLRRHVLRHRRGRAVRPAPDARRGQGHHAHHRDDQGRRQRAAAGRPSRAAGLRRHHHRPALRSAARGRTHRAATPSPSRPGRWTGTGPPRGRARSTVRRAAPAPAPRWPSCTPRDSWP